MITGLTGTYGRMYVFQVFASSINAALPGVAVVCGNFNDAGHGTVNAQPGLTCLL